MTLLRARLSIHIAAVLFGLTGIFGELIQASATVITAGRAGFAVLTFMVLGRVQGHGRADASRPQARSLTFLALAAAMLAVHWITFFIAVKTGGVALATLGFASFPAFITLGERFIFHEPVSSKEWLVLALVSLGLVLVTPSFDIGDQATAGLLWGLFSGLTFALFTLINRQIAKQLSPRQVARWENLFVLLLTLPFAVPGLVSMSTMDWLWMALLGVFCTALSHYLLVASMTVLKASSAGIVIALEPVYAIVFAAILFAQYPSARAIVGGILMIAAIVWSGLNRNPASNTA